MATKGYNLEQTGEQVQAALNRIINLSTATEETDGLMSSSDKSSLENLNTEINNKVDKVSGKGLSTNDFTNEEKAKVDSAYQAPSSGIPKADLSSEVQASLTNADNAVQGLSEVNAKIPAQATSQNQLADKAFVNSSVATASADFKGTYDTLQELQAVTADKNDYGYVVSTDSAGNTIYSRYKYTGSAWVFEYDLNNSSFTASEWAAIQSGITSAGVQKLNALPTNSELNTALAGKQATLVSGTNIKTVDGQSILGSGNLSVSDPNAVKVTAQTWTDAQKTQARTNIGAYAKPSGGIPKTDLASGVQGSLDLADSAIQARPSGEVDPTITPAEYATQEELAQLEAKVDGIDITEVKNITEASFELIIPAPLKSGIPATLAISGDIVVGDGLLNLDFYDNNGRQNRSIIYINGNPVIYTPTADIIRVEFLRVSTTGTGTVTATIVQKSPLKVELQTLSTDIDNLEDEIDELDESISDIGDIVNGTTASTELSIAWVNGYYTGAVLTPTGNGFASGPIDVRAYRGKVIRVTRNVNSDTARYCYYVDNNGVTQYLFSEIYFDNPDEDGNYYGDIPVSPDMSYLYISMAATCTSRKVEVLSTSTGLAQKDKKVFVSTTGDDLNDGSELHPKKSILSALNSGNIIIVDEGIYNESIDLDGFDYNRVSIKALPGKKAVIKMYAPILLNNGFETLVSGYTKVYQTPLATNPFAGKTTARMYQEGGEGDVTTLISEMDRHPLQRGRQYRCDTDIIKQCSSIDAIETLGVNENKCGFYWENGTMYFSRPRGTSGGSPVVMPVFGNCFLRATKDKKIELENIEVRYGNIHIENCTDVTFKNVAILYANVTDTGGFYFKDCTGVSLERCEAASMTDGAVAGDGFNFHTTSANGPEPHYLTAHLVDCWSHDNSDDGYSDHEYSEVTIDGGLFEFNGKGGITPSYGANDVIRNATSRYNISVERATGNGIYVTGDPTLERLKTCVIADGCVCYGNHFGLRSAQPECVLIARNCLVYGNDWGNYRANTGEGKLILIGCKSGNGSTTEVQNITTIEVS